MNCYPIFNTRYSSNPICILKSKDCYNGNICKTKTIIGGRDKPVSGHDKLRAPCRYENKVTKIYGSGRKRTIGFSQIDCV